MHTDQNKIKVLYISQNFPSPDEPSRGTHNGNKIRALAPYCDVRVISPVPWWSRIRTPGKMIRVPSATIGGLDAEYPAWWSAPRFPAAHARGLYASLRRRVRNLRREFPFDVIVASCAYPDAVAAAHLARELGCPLVTLVMGTDVNELPRWPALRRQIEWGLGQSHRVIAVSRALRDRVIDLGVPPQRVVLQYNGVDGNRFRLQDREVVRQRLGLPEDRRIVVYVGNLRPEKGVHVLLEAARSLDQVEAKGVDFLFVGGGPLALELQAKVSEYGLGDRVHLYGPRTNDEIADLVSAADVLCLPSFREGCPNVILESLAAGCPVVASEVGGVPELLSERTGILVPAGKPAALAEGLRQALSREWEPELLRASVPFLSWEQFGIGLLDIVLDATGRPGGGTSDLQVHGPVESLQPGPEAEAMGTAPRGDALLTL